MKRKHSIWLFVTVVVMLPILAFAVVTWYEKNYQQLPILGSDQHTISDFKMTNQQGRIITIKDWKGKIVVADFFFTHCPGICPKITRNLKIVQQSFMNDGQLQINSFSVDPEKDSVGRLSFYASQFNIKNDNWNLLTGSKKDIYRLARKSFLVVATDGDGGPNDFIHSDKLVLVDTKKRIRGFYDGMNESEIGQLIKDISKLKAEGSKN
ncbi:MAG: SCO family protein [Bacteroidota bacterium]|nr:SCO family protein [Bacteroidota bacterium]